jgi:AraC family transcriptional regulator, transcriptional activator of pobA
MQKQDINIAELNQLYQFDWGTNDFLVTDEQYPIKVDFPVRIDGYVIGISLKGSVTIEIDSVVYHGDSSAMLIAKPLQLFRFLELSDDCRVRFIIFSKRFLIANNINQQFIDQFRFSHPNALPAILISIEEAKFFVRQFEGIWNRFQELQHPYRKEVVASLLLILLHDFEAIYEKHFSLLETKNSRAQEITRQFTDLLQKHFRKQHGVGFYAKELCVTPKYLTSTIKEVTGKTTSTFIAEALSNEAQALLRQADVSVKQAANLLHFPDQSMFGKFFKKSLGMSPIEFKKALRK